MTDMAPPALSLQPIQTLADETDSGIALQFLSDYLEMLPARLQRIFTGLNGRDIEASLDAILSLKIASAMAGAFDTEAYCRGIEALVRAGQFPQALERAQGLAANVLCLISSTPAVLASARDGLDCVRAGTAPAGRNGTSPAAQR
ncbi:Hpt domain-containing protein [Arthrobacter sp. 9AX]|uniref:Hpt domain-containing protein n=1 Tax=Arthrobacter sp. 9AX TaxID=2653131 RepID=UPI0012F0C366|nr:Hpt domain-containing protein [Arthrobacter sp. 9AX]VXB77250.1 Hpt domain-containing protein [Arthrobacter sp. 9AX]